MVETCVPTWLTGEFLKSCLESDSESFPDVTITDHSVEPAVAAGNNYGSQMLRVNVRYKTPHLSPTQQSISLIVKAPLTVGYMQSVNSLYFKEPKYYNEFIQETYSLYKHNIVARSYACPNPQCVVMEDLKALGFEMVDRRKFLDLDHSRIFIMASAKLQALSIAVNKRNPELIKSIGLETAETTENWNNIYRTMMRKGLMCVATLLEDKSDYKYHVSLMKSLIAGDKLWKLYNKLETSDWPLKSFAQLDPWCTNMMFEYNSKREVVGVKLLDFQTTRWTSPLFELFTFIWVSVDPDVRRLELESLYKLYCDSFNTCLLELGCQERLTLEQLKSLAVDFSPLVLMAVCCFSPFSLHEGVTDVNDFVTGDLTMESVKGSKLFQMYQEPVFASFLTNVFDEMSALGIFDTLNKLLIKI